MKQSQRLGKYNIGHKIENESEARESYFSFITAQIMFGIILVSFVELTQKKCIYITIGNTNVNFETSYKLLSGGLPIVKADFLVTGFSSRHGVTGQSRKMMTEYR